MDPDVDPCDDFSSYVCGNFRELLQKHTYTQIDIEIRNEIKQLLKNQDISNFALPQTKAAIFYKSCLNIGKRNIEANPSITEFVKELTKDEAYEKNLISLLTSGLTSRFFIVDSKENPENDKYNILQIGEPNLILPGEILRSPEENENKKKIERYKAFMKNVLQTIGLCYESKDVIDGIVDLHVRLAEGFPTIKEQNENSANEISIKQLQNRCKKIPWKLLINGVLEKSNKQLEEDETFYIFSWDYVDVLCSVFQEYLENSTKLKILKMDIQWAAIQALIPYGSEELMDAEDKLNKERRKELWETCVNITLYAFPDILGNIHAKNTFPVSKREDIEFMIKNVRKATTTNMEEITWLDSESKSAALIKIKAMKYQIGYPDFFLCEEKLKKDNEKFSFHIDKFMENQINFASVKFTKLMDTIGEKSPDDYLSSPFFEDNAYNDLDLNKIGFQAGILRYPYYDIDFPININYGSTGMTIGHEMMHGFDTEGISSDEEGNEKDWLSPKSKEEFNKRVKCITDQYGQYKVYNEYLRPNETIGDDIADNSGLRMAYKGLHLPDERREKMTLPGLDFTPEQLFFISNARSFCEFYTKDEALNSLNTAAEHTFWKFRINGPMSNMPEFSKHFKCGRNKIMNRPRKCVVW